MRGVAVCCGLTVALTLAACAGQVERPVDTSPTVTGATRSTATSHGAGGTHTPSTRSGAVPTGTGASTATSDVEPPYIARVEWVQAAHGRSLHIYPTTAGRHAQGLGDDATAWREVLRLAPDAGSAGMRAQFECHWVYARLAEPGKTSWNIEPWRPVVTDDVMTQERCNPGGPD